jgi:hypothetical protein
MMLKSVVLEKGKRNTLNRSFELRAKGHFYLDQAYLL